MPGTQLCSRRTKLEPGTRSARPQGSADLGGRSAYPLPASSTHATPARVREGASNPLHNTRGLTVRVYYPFHPLNGLDLEVACMARDESGPMTVVAPDGDRLKIPQWMLSPAAASASLTSCAVLSTAALLALAALVEHGVASRAPQRNRRTVSLSSTGSDPTREEDGAAEARPDMVSGRRTDDLARDGSSGNGQTHGRRNRGDARDSKGGQRR